MPNYAIIEAPSILGLRETGVDRLADALLSAGSAGRLHARRAGRVEPPRYSPQRDPTHGMLNADSIARYTPALADAVGAVIDREEFPVVLGGDCSIVLGSLLALRRRGRFGLLFTDGHADFYQPEANINGEAASSDLALATGRGPAEMTVFEGRAPLVRDEDVVAFGYRDEDEQRAYGSQPLPPSMLALNLATIRRMGIERAVQTSLARLTRDGVDGFWIHVDVDVLDDEIMPAVDYRLPDGLSWSDLVRTLQLALASSRAVGLEVTIFNPAMDPDGRLARQLVTALTESMAS